MSVLVLVVILCCVVFAWSWLRPRHHSPPVYPGALPLIGHALLGLDRKDLWNTIQKIQIYTLKKTGGVCQLHFGFNVLYMITDPEDTLTITNLCLDKLYLYHFADDFMRNGLLLEESSLWKTHRKLLNPAFNQQVLNTYVNDMNLQARSLASTLASKVGKDPFDVRKYFVSFTMSIVTRTSFGLNTEDQATIDTDYAKGIDDLLALFCDRLQKIIQERKSELKANKNQNIQYDDSTGKFKPLLDQMLNMAEEQDAFTDDDIRQHLDTIVASAYDTTSSALTFILLVTGSYQDVQERIFKELQEVLPHKDVDLIKEDLQKLVYLEAVIKETLRLYPVSPIIGRKVDMDVNLKNYKIAAGDSCVIGLYGLLRHPMWGADAEQFRPERWLDPATLPKHPALHAAYSVGKRNCIGKLFSMMMMKIALAHILRQYHVTGDIHNLVCEYDVILRPVKGHLIGLTLRT